MSSVTFLQAAFVNTNLTTYTFSAQNLGTAADDRYIVIGVTSTDASATCKISSATIGGVSVNFAINTENTVGGSTMCAIGIAKVPTGTTGDVVVVFNETSGKCGISLYSTNNIEETPFDFKGQIGDDPSLALNVPMNGFCIGIGMNASSSGAGSFTGLTEDAETTFTGEAAEMYSASLNSLSLVAPLTVTLTLTVAETESLLVCASWQSKFIPRISIF